MYNQANLILVTAICSGHINQLSVCMGIIHKVQYSLYGIVCVTCTLMPHEYSVFVISRLVSRKCIRVWVHGKESQCYDNIGFQYICSIYPLVLSILFTHKCIFNHLHILCQTEETPYHHQAFPGVVTRECIQVIGHANSDGDHSRVASDSYFVHSKVR